MLNKEFNFNSSDVYLGRIFLALVVDNMDSTSKERIKVRVLGVHDMTNEEKDNSIWAGRICPSKNTSGDIPDPDDWVYVTFMNPNDPMSCLWLGWARTNG